MNTRIVIIIGITLYVLWILSVVIKFNILPKNRSFSYRSAFFGTILWYKNWRNLLLLCALFLLDIFAPLKSIFLLFTLSCLLFCILCGNNLRQKIGKAWISLSLCLLFLISCIFSSSFIFLL